MWKQTTDLSQILTLLPPMEVAQAALSRPAEHRVAMAVRFQAASAGTSALSASDPAFRLHLLVLRFSNASLVAYRVLARVRILGSSFAQEALGFWTSALLKVGRVWAAPTRVVGLKARRLVPESWRAPRGFVVHVCFQAKSTTRRPPSFREERDGCAFSSGC